MPSPNVPITVDDDYEIMELESATVLIEDNTLRMPVGRRSGGISGHESQLSFQNPKAAPSQPCLLFRTPLQNVTIRVQGQEFHVHKELLVKDSLYFERALNGAFLEARKQEIVIDDILPGDFGFYVDILYRSFFSQNFILRKEQTGGTLSTKQLLGFWQLADRFLNDFLTNMAKESLSHRLSLYSESQWNKLHIRRPKEDIEDRIRRLQEAYHQCIDGDIPFTDDIVAAAANCPGQVYADCVHLLEPEFMALVSKKMIMDLTLAKKRTADQMLGRRTSQRDL